MWPLLTVAMTSSVAASAALLAQAIPTHKALTTKRFMVMSPVFMVFYLRGTRWGHLCNVAPDSDTFDTGYESFDTFCSDNARWGEKLWNKVPGELFAWRSSGAANRAPRDPLIAHHRITIIKG